MKYFFLQLALFICLAPALQAQTQVSGYILSNTTWTLAGSPYIVTGNILVINGVTLTIEPGVTVKFDTTKTLQVDGGLIAVGTAQNRITFTANDATPVRGSWGRVQFSNTSTDAMFDSLGNYVSGNIMKYCDIEYGGGVPGDLTVYCDTAAPYFSHCRISECLKHAVSFVEAAGRIDSSVVRNCGGKAINFANPDPMPLTISNDTIENNVNGIVGNGSTITVRNCIFTSTGDALNITGEAGSFILNNVFTTNVNAIKGDLGDSSIISNNVFMGQTISVIGGPNCIGEFSLNTPYTTLRSSLLEITNNHFENNTGSIYVSGYNATTSITNNTFLNNQFHAVFSCSSGSNTYTFIKVFNGGGIFTNNILDGNSTAGGNGSLVSLFGGWEIANNTVKNNAPGLFTCSISVICHNQFLNNSGAVMSGSPGTAYIHDNGFTGNSGGGKNTIAMFGSPGTYPIINNNEFAGNSPVSSVIALTSNNETTVSNNRFTGNIIPDTASLIIINSSTSVIHHNDFLNNTGLSCIRLAFNYYSQQPVVTQNNFINPAMDYEIENRMPFGPGANVNIPDNYWGTTNTAHIDSVIKDYFDDANLSVAYYFPLLPAPALVDTNDTCIHCTLSLSATLVHPTSCFGSGGSSINVIVTHSPFPYYFHWNTGYTGNNLPNMPGGTYSVTVTDAYGCSDTASFTLIQPTVPVIDGIVTKVNCNSGGFIDVSVSSGTSPFTYNWGNGITTQDRSGLTAGNYTVTVSDGTGCTVSKLFNVGTSAAPSVSGALTHPHCFGGCDGAINLTVTGVTPFTYNWGNGFGTTEDTSGLCSGTYNVTVADSNNCTTTKTYNVLNGLHVYVGAISGSITAYSNQVAIYSVNGNAGYNYDWSVSRGTILSGQGTNGIEVFWTALGQATVQLIFSYQGCSDTVSKTITVVDTTNVNGPLVSGVVTNESCFSSCDGAINLTVAGVPPFTFNWGNGFGAIEDTSGLCAGTYYVSIADSNFNLTLAAFTVASPATLDVTASIISDVSCHGYSDGIAVSVANGGTLPYNFSWNHGGTADTATGLAAGIAFVTVTDAYGCSAIASVTLPDGFNPYVGVIIGSNTGVVQQSNVYSVNAGFNANYAWSVSNGTILSGQGTNSIEVEWNSVGQGMIQLIVSQGCADTVSKPVTVTDDVNIPSPAVSGTVINASCYGSCDGVINLSVTGAPPFTYNWGNGFGTTKDTAGLCPGVYNVTVADSVNNFSSALFSILSPRELNVTASVVGDVSCSGTNDGVARVTVSGGLSPYSFEWSDGQEVDTATGLGPGPHGVTVTDVAGCTGVASVNVADGINVFAGVISGFSNAQTNQPYIYLVNASANYSYTWSIANGSILNGQGTNSIEVDWDSAGQGNILLIISAQSCTDTISKTVTVSMPTGIQDDLLNNIALYPNPTNNNFTITVTGVHEQATLLLFDALGREVLQQIAQPQQLNDGMVVDMSPMHAGFYLLNVRTSNGNRVRKVVKY